MKLYLPLLFTSIIIGEVSAQEIPQPHILPEAYAQKINPAGTALMAQDIAGNAIVYGIKTGEELWYGGYYPGNGNCLANNGMLVGQDMETSRAAIMKEAAGEVPASFSSYASSTLDAITPDGTRACGWVQNPKGGPIAVPVYCDIAEDGSFGEVHMLPYPSKDFFNDTPQYCTAVCISDDGKTIAGLVQDGTGFFSYPIIYKQNVNGEWSYTFPSEPMFNPDHLEIPKYPDLDSDEMPRQPQITDFMTPEKKKEWEEDMAQYEETNDPDMNPWSYVTYFTGEDGYAAFEQAIVDYYKKVNEILGNLIDNYWKEMAKVGKYACFIPNIALSPKGDTLVIDLGILADEYATDVYSGYDTYIFNLTDSSYSLLESQYKNLIPTQILNDGTLITVSSPSSELLPYNGYILLPGEKELISFEEFVKKNAPAYLPWLTENLNLLDTGVISGIVSLSEDKSVMAGGLPVGQMMSYIIAVENASVNSIESLTEDTYNVYSLSGTKVMTTKEKSEISRLPKGIYIINGKKIKL